MIPMMARLHVKSANHRFGIRLWIPLFLLWILLLPLVLVVLPFLAIACLVVRVNFFRLLATLTEILAAFKGTVVEVEESKNRILIEIY